jgi:type I restriction enzyme S subunit
MKDVVDLRGDKVAVESEEENYLELEDLEGGRGRILSRRDTLSVESAVTRFSKGDVLFGKLRPYLEKYCQPDFDGYCTGEILAFFPRRIYGRYLFCHMGSDWLIQRCNALAYGAKMPRVNWPTQLALFDVPLPPLPEQQRIAAYLDASCAAIDEAVETKQKQLETLDALRKSIIQRAVTQGLNPKVKMKDSGIHWVPRVPSHWKVTRIKREVNLVRGQFTPRPRSDPRFYGGPYPFIQTGSISATEKYITDYRQTLNEEGLRVSRMFPSGTIVMTITGAKIGEVAMTTFDACFPDSVVGFIPNHHVDNEFLFYLLVAMKPALLQSIIVTTQPNINYVQIGSHFIALPETTEQKEIVEMLEVSLEKLRGLRESLGAQITTLIAYRKSLIHECVTGKRRISNADVAKVEAHV